MTLGVGIHSNVPEDVYHRDPAERPSLSSSIAHILLTQTPRHAWMAHPRLNPQHEAENSKTFDIGTAAHEILLEGSERRIVPVDAKDYKTAAAQAARDGAYAAGKTPLLPHHLEQVRAMVAAAHAQLRRHEEAAEAFVPKLGKPEQTGIWEEPDGVLCRMRIDWLPNGGNVLFDYKTTTSANPDDFVKRAFNLGHATQAPFYRRGMRALTGKDWRFRWVVQEVTPPYALSVCELDPGSMALVDRKIDYAIARWEYALRNDHWGGYDRRVHYLQAPVWEERGWLEREERAKIMADAGEDERAFLLNWQAPAGGSK